MVNKNEAMVWRLHLRRHYLAQHVVPYRVHKFLREEKEWDLSLEDARAYLSPDLSSTTWKRFFKNCFERSITLGRHVNVFDDLTIPNETAVKLLEDYARQVSFRERSGDICHGLLPPTDAPTWMFGDDEYVQLRDGILLFFTRKPKRDECTISRMTDNATLLKARLIVPLLEALEQGGDFTREAKTLSRLKKLFWAAWESRKSIAEKKFDEASLVTQQHDMPHIGWVFTQNSMRAYAVRDDGAIVCDPDARRICPTPTLVADSRKVLNWVEEHSSFSSTVLSTTLPEELTIQRKGLLGQKEVPYLDMMSEAIRACDVPLVIDEHCGGVVPYAYAHESLVEH